MEIEVEEINKPKLIKENISTLDHSAQKLEKDLKNKLGKIFKLNINSLNYKGHGGSSLVYEANIDKKKEPIVIKVIRDEKYKNVNEIKIMEILHYKNIISLYGSYLKENEDQFIVMERGKMDLKNFLSNLLKRYTYTETFACYICYQVLEGLKHLYKCNIIHYDIKPNNIILDDYLNLKIIDFSSSENISGIKGLSEIILKYKGTSFYMAPEVIKREKIKVKDFHKIDLFSLGVMLYRLTFGFYPFNLEREDADNDDIIYQKINSDWKAKNKGTEFSKYFLDFLNCLLEKDINKRINIYDAMNHYWVQGAKILMEEKENIYNANVFLTSLLTDNFLNFNRYIF
jgi:serine/threonine protein kinase